ncbi:MAG: SDR family oxidoreductase [Novosphingobium sp.]
MSARRVLLVGATQGLGLALAQRYRAEGWDVVATTIAPSPALEALEGVTVLPLDITDEGQALALRDALAGQRIDVLHIVAGILPQGDAPIWERADEEILRVLKTNAIGSVRLATLLEPLVPEGGTFAFTSSGMGSMVRNTLAGADLYRVSKAALNMLVRSFAVTHGGKRAVLIICPGWAKTGMGGADATVEVADSVDGIYRLVSTARPCAEGAPFLEYTGDTVPW